MPQAITHYLLIEQAMQKDHPFIWEKYKNVAGFASFAPDLFYLKDIGWLGIFNYGYSEISDIMHWEGSLHFFSNMLDHIKIISVHNPTKANKLKAFAYGYYSHVIIDAIMHPWIYRVSNDHWKHHWENQSLHDSSGHFNLKHKRIEATIDCYLAYKYHDVNSYDFDYEKKILCFNPNKQSMLDIDIFDMFHTSMDKTYKAIINKSEYSNLLLRDSYFEYFSKYDTQDSEHPIHESYDDFVDTITELYTIKLLKFLEVPRLKALLPRKKLKKEEYNEYLNLNHANWIGSNGISINYSIEELFEISLSHTKAAIKTSENFFKNSEINAFKYLKAHALTAFLKNDFNLDTGLPSSFNHNAQLLNNNNYERSSFNINIISEQYKDISIADNALNL